MEVRLQPVPPDLLLSVADSGPGVPPAEREVIFSDGWSTKPNRTGARRGLGLAMVREVVQRRGGIVDVGQDVGAVFSVLLPGVAVARHPDVSVGAPAGGPAVGLGVPAGAYRA